MTPLKEAQWNKTKDQKIKFEKHAQQHFLNPN